MRASTRRRSSPASAPSTRRSRPTPSTPWRPPTSTSTSSSSPVGTGPFKFVDYSVGRAHRDGRQRGLLRRRRRTSRQLFFPIIKDDLAGGQALAAGQADWKYSLTGPTYDEIKTNPALKFVEYPDFGFYSLYFNQREGTLFADKNLRQALSYCMDKEATVAAATSGAGVAIYSEIPPASWAFPTQGLNTYPMDQAKSKELIESSGWTLGSDGIYEKAGQKLSTDRRRARRPAGPQQVDAAHVRPGQAVRDGHPVPRDRLHGAAQHADARTRTSMPRRRRPASRSMPTSVASTPASTRTRSRSTTRPSARPPSARTPTTTSATRTPRSTSSSRTAS